MQSDVEELLQMEGFRVPLRRMLGSYVDGLAGRVLTSSKRDKVEISQKSSRYSIYQGKTPLG